jgi:4-amino-4-deoxy-L-arabinose transferase-like glycosyltransferase
LVRIQLESPRKYRNQWHFGRGFQERLLPSAPLPADAAFTTRLSASVERWLGVLTLSHGRAAAALIALSLLLFTPGLFALQPMDRDEPRFAQATKQMLETGDFVDIRFQDDARHKKPVGIYWLQSATVSGAKAVGVPDAMRTIGLYRLPSWLAAIGSVLLVYWAALAFLSRRGAFVAAALMASTVLIGVEARLAKTDATLLFTCLVGFGVLARAWFAAVSPATAQPLTRLHVLAFWLAMGLGVLVKGPITPMIVFVPALALSLRERSARWLLQLKPLLGLGIVIAMAAPWLIAIAVKTGGSFFADSVGKDMLGKVGQGQERHWGPPGLYATLFWATAWPLAVFMALAFHFTWKERKDDGVAFLLAWIIPCWIIFEAVQTKLPHYVLPLYPAIAVLAVMAVERDGVPFHWRSAKWASALALLAPLLILGAGVGGFWHFDRTVPFFALPFLIAAAILAFIAMRALQRAEPMAGAALLVASAVTLTVAAYPFGLSQLQAVNISKRLASAARAVPCEKPEYASAGFNEPSLVFLTDTEIELAEGKVAAAMFAKPGCKIAFVDQRHEGAFRSSLDAVQDKPGLRTRVKGININSGRMLDIGVYVRER